MQINNISDREAMFFLSSLAELGYASKRAIYENIKPLYSIFEMNFDNLKMKVKLSEKLNSEQHQKFAVKKGDILIRIRNPIKAVYVDKKYKNLFLSDIVVCVRNYKDYDANFLVSYFNAYADQEFNNAKQINLNNIASIKIPNFKQDKQKEVSNFISNIDNRNRELREQIQKNNELKKTTLQELSER